MSRKFDSYEALREALLALSPDDILPSVELTPVLAEAILKHDPINRDLRKANVEKLKREILGGYWDHRKSSFMRFMERDGRLADGQHRCRAVIEAGQSIIVHIATAPDTLGMDQGAIRSLADQLKIHDNLAEKQQRDLAATVTKTLCKIPSANDRELITFFEANKAFILECVIKPLEWLADKEPSTVAVMKPALLAVTRAQEIMLYGEPASEVDELLEDVVNAGMTAPENSPRRAAAKQIWDAMQNAFTKRGAKTKDMLKWVHVAIEQKRKGAVKNIMLARFSRKARAKRSAELITAITTGQPVLNAVVETPSGN